MVLDPSPPSLPRSICLNMNQMIWSIWIMDHLSEWHFCYSDFDLIVWIRIYIQTRSLSKRIRIVGVLFFLISESQNLNRPHVWQCLLTDTLDLMILILMRECSASIRLSKRINSGGFWGNIQILLSFDVLILMRKCYAWIESHENASGVRSLDAVLMYITYMYIYEYM